MVCQGSTSHASFLCLALLTGSAHGALFAMNKAENCEPEKEGARTYYAVDACLIEGKKYTKVSCSDTHVIVTTFEDTGCTKKVSDEKFKLGCKKKGKKKGLWECDTQAKPLSMKMYMDNKCSGNPIKYNYVPEGMCLSQGGKLGQVWWKYVCIDGRMEKFEFTQPGCVPGDSQKPSSMVIPGGTTPSDQCQPYNEKYGIDHGCDDGGLRTTPGAKDKPKSDDDDEL